MIAMRKVQVLWDIKNEPVPQMHAIHPSLFSSYCTRILLSPRQSYVRQSPAQ